MLLPFCKRGKKGEKEKYPEMMTWKRKRIQQKWNNITNRIEWFTVIERKENETKGWETNEKNKNWHSEVKGCNCSSLAIHLVSFSFSFHHRKYLSLSLVLCVWMALLGEWTLSLPPLQMQHINKPTRAPAQSDRDISKLFVSNALSVCVCARGEQSPRKAVYVSANRICGQCTPNAPNRTWNIRDGSLSSHFSLPGIASNCIVSLFSSSIALLCCCESVSVFATVSSPCARFRFLRILWWCATNWTTLFIFQF